MFMCATIIPLVRRIEHRKNLLHYFEFLGSAMVQFPIAAETRHSVVNKQCVSAFSFVTAQA